MRNNLSPKTIIWRRFKRHRLALAGAGVLCILCVTAILAEVIVPYDRDEIDLMRIQEGPSHSHLLGTDDVGRDILSRLIHAGRVSLGVGFSAMGLALLIGISLGSMAGFYGGWLDNLIMRLVDVMLSIPIFFPTPDSGYFWTHPLYDCDNNRMHKLDGSNASCESIVSLVA